MTCDGFWNLGPSDATHHPSAVLAAGLRAWEDERVRGGEVHGVSAAIIVPRSGPIDPVGITVDERRTIRVPGIDEIIWI